MTRYEVLRTTGNNYGGEDHPEFYLVDEVAATNAQQACRKVAETMADVDLEAGVTLVAIPARNWASGRNTFAAKTERKLIRS